MDGDTMKKIFRLSAMLLCLFFVLALGGCALSGNDEYTVVARLEEQELCIAFRQEDKVGSAVTAALYELQAEGKVDDLTEKWLGEKSSLLKEDENAVSELDFEISKRDFLVGYDPGRLPFSGETAGGEPIGLDVELAKLVCRKLGWTIKFVPINVAHAKTELDSGNVDCVWGALAYDEDAQGISQSPVYVKNTVLIAAERGSGITGMNSLKGKTLALSELGCFSRVLEENPEAGEKAEYVVRLPGGCDECFDALDDGSCDAILTDLAAIEYYDREN